MFISRFGQEASAQMTDGESVNKCERRVNV